MSPLPTCAITPSKHLVRRIKKGKFTNFDCLLGPGNEEGWGALQLQGRREGEKKASKRCVGDFASWMEAWNVYLAIRVQSAPRLAQQLIKYQAIITQLFSSYPANVCIKYDTCFRQAVARDKARSIPWDHLKEDLLVWCATRQPFRAFKPSGQGLNTARQTPTAPGATQSGARTLHVASGQEICRRYNFGNCARADCKFAHGCWTVGCGGDHPGKSCPRAAPAPPG